MIKKKTKKIKMYEVSIVCDGIEATDEASAISQFEELVETGYFGRDSYEVRVERD